MCDKKQDVILRGQAKPTCPQQKICREVERAIGTLFDKISSFALALFDRQCPQVEEF